MNTSWPAIRLSINSRFNGTGGSVNGSFAEGNYEEGGGDAIHINNGQSSPDTASHAEFYDGITVSGGAAPSGVGGNALLVNGFGTEATLFGGNFFGGAGAKGNGLSIYVFNSAMVHIHGGIFKGEMKAERNGAINFYGCFMRNATRVTGLFADETKLDIDVRTNYGGEVILIPVSEQECDTAPSVEPTAFPTLSPRPTIPRSKGERQRFSTWLNLLEIFLFLRTILLSL